MVRDQKPQVIFLDLVMPGMGGFETLRRLKADPLTSDIPVIVYTSKTVSEVEREALASGASAVVQKGTRPRQEAMAELRNLIVRLRKRG